MATCKTFTDALAAIGYEKKTIPALFGTCFAEEFGKINESRIKFVDKFDIYDNDFNDEFFPKAILYKNIYEDWPKVIFINNGGETIVTDLPHFEESVNIVLVDQSKLDYPLFGKNVKENVIAVYDHRGDFCDESANVFNDSSLCSSIACFLLKNTKEIALNTDVVVGNISCDFDSYITSHVAATVCNIAKNNPEDIWNIKPNCIWAKNKIFAMSTVLGVDLLCYLASTLLVVDNVLDDKGQSQQLFLDLKNPWQIRVVGEECLIRPTLDPIDGRDYYYSLLNKTKYDEPRELLLADSKLYNENQILFTTALPRNLEFDEETLYRAFEQYNKWLVDRDISSLLKIAIWKRGKTVYIISKNPVGTSILDEDLVDNLVKTQNIDAGYYCLKITLKKKTKRKFMTKRLDYFKV